MLFHFHKNTQQHAGTHCSPVALPLPPSFCTAAKAVTLTKVWRRRRGNPKKSAERKRARANTRNAKTKTKQQCTNKTHRHTRTHARSPARSLSLSPPLSLSLSPSLSLSDAGKAVMWTHMKTPCTQASQQKHDLNEHASVYLWQHSYVHKQIKTHIYNVKYTDTPVYRFTFSIYRNNYIYVYK